MNFAVVFDFLGIESSRTMSQMNNDESKEEESKGKINRGYFY